MLGLARAEAEPGSELDELLLDLERDLWVLMAEVATAPENRHKLVAGTSLVTAEMVSALEVRIDALNERFEMPTEFVVPGQNRVSAALDVARTVVRRAERGFTGVASHPSSQVGPYLNRLSDLLWTMARWQEGEHVGVALARARRRAPARRAATGRRRRARVRARSARRCSGSPGPTPSDPAALADAAGVPVGGRWAFPCSRRPTGPPWRPGVPATVVVGAGGHALSTALDAARARQRGFTGKVGQTMAS